MPAEGGRVAVLCTRASKVVFSVNPTPKSVPFYKALSQESGSCRMARKNPLRKEGMYNKIFVLLAASHSFGLISSIFNMHIYISLWLSFC
jgi:hypothetical protein